MLFTQLAKSQALTTGLPACAPLPRLCYPSRLGICIYPRQQSPKYKFCISRRAGAAIKAQAAAAAGGGEAAAAQEQQRGRHAFLHDFCLCIPYGAFIALGGLAMMLFSGGRMAALVAGAGVAQVVLSNLSLKAWRARRSHTLFTALEAGISGALTYEAVSALHRGAPRLLHTALGLLSGAMTLFLVYNILSGGNPPPKAAAAAAEEGA